MKCHLLPLTTEIGKALKMEKVRQKEENGKEDVKKIISAEFLLHWDKGGENAGGNMSKLQFLGLFLSKKWKWHSFFFFSFSEVVLHEVPIRKKIQFFFFSS